MENIENQIFIKLKEIAGRLLKIQQEILNDIKISSNYYKVITTLKMNKEINQTKLSQLCSLDKPATSRLVEKMTNENYINKSTREGNKKNIYISLANKGIQLATEIEKKFKKIAAKYFSELKIDDKKIFLSLLNKNLKGEITQC